MRWSLLVSFLIHTAILIAAVVVLPSSDPSDMVDTASIPVELVTLDEVTQRQAMREEVDEQPKPEEKPAPPEAEEVEKPEPEPAPEPEEAAQPPQPQPEPEPEPEPEQAEAQPEPEPAPEPEPTPEPEPEPEPAPEPEEPEQQAKPAPTPRTKPTPPPKVAQEQPEPEPEEEFNPDEISALLNKLPDQQRGSPQDSEVTGTPLEGPAEMSGQDNRVTANELEWLRRQISRCWRPPPGLTAAPDLVVRLQFAMDRNGAVSGSPQLLNSSAVPQFRAAADAAIRAVLACQPYDMPPEKYESWSEVILNFDPSEMYGT